MLCCSGTTDARRPFPTHVYAGFAIYIHHLDGTYGFYRIVIFRRVRTFVALHLNIVQTGFGCIVWPFLAVSGWMPPSSWANPSTTGLIRTTPNTNCNAAGTDRSSVGVDVCARFRLSSNPKILENWVLVAPLGGSPFVKTWFVAFDAAVREGLDRACNRLVRTNGLPPGLPAIRVPHAPRYSLPYLTMHVLGAYILQEREATGDPVRLRVSSAI